MLEKVKKFAEEYHMLSPGDTVAAGVSGGADSVCLLFALRELQRDIPFRLLVVHVNHLIRPDAGRDAAYVEELCRRWDVPYFLVERDVSALAAAEKMSVEEAGREARYEAFAQVLLRQAPGETEAGRAKIAVAHNAGDRAETMLFHLFRGTGLSGLSGIRPVRDNIIRPLLCLERTEIETFLRERGISYCIDSTNAADTYTRNKIRNHILPYVEREIAAGAAARMNNTADILLEAGDFVQQCVRDAYNQCVTRSGDGTLRMSAAPALALHPFLRGQLLLFCLGEAAGGGRDLTAANVRDLESLLSRGGNRAVHLPYGVCARREYGEIVFEKRGRKEAPPAGERIIYPETGHSVEVPGLGTLDFQVFPCENSHNIPENQYTKWFDYDKMIKPLRLRTRRAGDYLTVDGTHTKSLQDYMVNEKIPRQERDSIWLLADGSHVVWVIGRRISQRYKIEENTKRILQVRLKRRS